MPDKKELLRRGMPEEAVIDRETHPAYYESSWPITEREQSILAEKSFAHHPHIRPSSVYVAVIGNHWVENGHWRIQDMLRSMEKKGYTIAFDEILDGCGMPADRISQMRTQATYQALDAGCEFLFMVETDALLELDTLERLMAIDFAVVAPFIVDLEGRHPGIEKHLSGPILQPNSGLYPVVWTVMSVMLFKTRVFNAIGPDCWGSHFGINEYGLSQRLNHVGHSIYVDTNNIVNVARSPGRPRSKSWKQYWEDAEKHYDSSRNEERDRRPPPGYDPVFGESELTAAGAYEPFHGSAFHWKQSDWNGKPAQTETRAARRRREKTFKE